MLIWPVDEQWPVSVVGGEWQGSDAHAARGEGFAFDIATPVGVQTRCIFPWGDPVSVIWFGIADTPCGGQFDVNGKVPTNCVPRGFKAGDLITFRFCHLSSRASSNFPLTGNTGYSTGPHLHVKIWVNGEERCFEDFDWSRDIYSS